MSFKKILVPVDFSEFSDKAVEYALFIAEKYGAAITLLHAIVLFEEDFDEKEHLEKYKQIVQKKEEERAKLLDPHIAAAEQRGVTISSAVTRGYSTSDCILEYINDNDFDLVVMGTHGRTGFKKLILGSVTESVVRQCSFPVLTIHKDFNKMDIKRILVPVDFTEYSKSNIEIGKALAKEFDAKLEFLHVVEEQAHPEFYSISFEPILKANPGLKDHITKSMIKLTGIPEGEAIYSVKEGKVYHEITRDAGSNQVDLIIMGSRGISDLEHLILGSNSERVIRIAPCPVLTVGQSSLA